MGVFTVSDYFYKNAEKAPTPYILTRPKIKTALVALLAYQSDVPVELWLQL